MNIYVNQLGYLPISDKVAVFAFPQYKDAAPPFVSGPAYLCKENGDRIFESTPVVHGWDESSGDYLFRMNFSEVTEEGTYFIQWNDTSSHPFTIGSTLYRDLNVLLARALYYQRCGMELSEKHAGKFARPACHTAPTVLWTEYEKFLAGELAESDMKKFDIRGGWHDAGDYGRYTTAGACALAHILYAYRFFPDSFALSLNIPESGNGTPDILNECRYELDWLLQMQAEDGSVSHKHTTLHHAAFVMPHEDTNQMLLLPASSMATASFAAVLALASRIYRPFDAVFADKAFSAAKKAYDWLTAHPDFLFDPTPNVHTGGYGDRSDLDERMWASLEFFRCTGEIPYLEKAYALYKEQPYPIQYGWNDISGFAAWALLEPELMPEADLKESFILSTDEQGFRTDYKERLLKEANHLLDVITAGGYGVALGVREYPWGSNLMVLNRGMLFGTSYLLTAKPEYRNAVTKQMDYLLGVNATDYSYVAGVGAHAFCNPHNRVTVADGIDETIPGFVSGGANGHPSDEKAKWMLLPDTPPMKCYLDIWECYSLNEVAIYWNSPAIFCAAFLDSIR